MGARFQRGGQAGISFFAFQDIITSVIGILIIVTLLLALHLEDETAVSSEGTPADPASAARLEDTLDALAALRGQIEKLQLANAVQDPASVVAENDLLKAQVTALENRRDQLRKESEAMGGQPSKNVVGDVAKLIERQKEAMETLRKQAAASQAAMLKLEQEAKKLESTLATERDRQNVLRVIPERTDTSKEPLLVLVANRQISLQRFDAGEIVAARTPDDFREQLKRFSKLDQYFVFYFKPSGVDHFEALTDAARDAGFEVGYDAIPEDVEIEFRSAPTPAPAP